MIMNSRFLVVLMATALYVALLHMSLLQQLLAFNPETGNVTTTSVKCIDSERQALLSLKQGFELSQWETDWLASWGDGENQKECCSWEGVHCSNQTGHVLILDLHSDDYMGVNSISPSLGDLHHLNYLDLSNISPYFPDIGQFFDILGSLTFLRHLDLSYCYFSGNIPPVLGNLVFLEYLDLRENSFEGHIPSQISNLSHLVHLDLGLNNFIGTIPLHFGNLSNLQYLDLSFEDISSYFSTDLQWLSHLFSLRYLSLSAVNLSTANSWQRIVSGLSHLQYLDFHGCNLLDSSSPPSLSPAANFSTSLSFFDISDNHLMNSSLIFPWLMNSTSSLSILRMNNNTLKGTIPEAFRDLSSLEELNLADNFLDGQILVSLFNSCKLKVLDISNNRQTGQFHEFVQALSRCAHKPSLETLHLGWNEITGMVSDLSQFSSLQELDLNHNGLNGTIHEGIGKLSNLTFLSLGNNKLKGLISEAHFSRLSNLRILDLSRNRLAIKVSSEWVLPFSLTVINLASCNVGPDFPGWLRSKQYIEELDISHAEINSTVPDWFWSNLPSVALNISHNYLRGKIETIVNSDVDWTSDPYIPLNFPIGPRTVDLSSNMFDGPIPAFATPPAELFLSNNLFSSANLLLCSNSSQNIRFLDLSNNSLRGELPDCWMHFESLLVLDLSNNYFHGNIPTSMGSLRNIQSLHLGDNNFSGEIPLSLKNCTKLVVFHAAGNRLSGILPSWIGDSTTKLIVLSLRSNKFHGSMPLSICNLGNLRVLDLSLNYLSGNIPKCISNLSAMAIQENSDAIVSQYYESIRPLEYTLCYLFPMACHYYLRVYNDSASLIWKGTMSKYKSILGLLISIDFSSNLLVGQIPSEFMSLANLVSLNISRNMLSGRIPQTIGQLKSLESLDLSRNHLFGKIPSQLAILHSLSVLDLSYNDLSGEIPQGTQLQVRDASAYVGNPKLCGVPLNTCPIPGHQVDENDAHVADEQFFTNGFHIAMAIGFVTGFWGVCFSLIFKKSWRYAYFKFWSDAYDKLYVLAAIKIAKLQRMHRN